MLVLADMQIITGLAILISGFSSIKCRMSSYHWQIIVYLASLSSMTHLSTLTFLRNYLYNHRAEYISRLVLMLALIALLCVAVIPTAFFDFHGDSLLDFKPSYFAICFYQREMDTSTLAFQSMISFLFLSVYGYAIRIAKMSHWVMTRSHRTTAYINQRFNRQVELWKPLESSLTARGVLIELVARPLFIALLGVITVQLSLFGSLLAEVGYVLWGVGLQELTLPF